VSSRDRAPFLTTRWSLVLAAGKSPSDEQRAALETLCRHYWPPLYGFVRRKGHTAEEALDLTQEFFARLLARDDLARADPSRGRFRAYLLTALKHFLVNEWERARTQKRGGGQRFRSLDLPLDPHDADARIALDPADPTPPDKTFEREWAHIVLKLALERLATEQARAQRPEQWARLEPYLTTPETTVPYATVARDLGVTENAIKIAIHRLRKRYAELLREEVAHTLQTDDVDAELHELFSALG
jgi:RNA polymerase sigma-70 factor (ECF subfamily)